MSTRTRINLTYQCSRGAARSKIEKYLRDKEFKKTTIRGGGFVWLLNIKNSDFIKCVETEFGEGTVTLWFFLAGSNKKHKYMEEDINGISRFISKRQMWKMVKDMQKMFE